MRILVIGHHIRSAAVDSFTWTNLRDGINPSEYDCVVVDTTLAEEELSAEAKDVSLPPVIAFLDLLKSHKHLIYIRTHNNIRVSLGTGKDGFPMERSIGLHRFMPCAPDVSELQSTTCNCQDSRYQRYLDCISSYSFYFRPDQPKRVLLPELVNRYLGEYSDCFAIKPLPIALSNADRPLAMSFSIIFAEEISHRSSMIRRYRTEPDRREIATLKTVTWLPPASNRSKEALLVLLEDLFEITEAPLLPEWCANYFTTEQRQLSSKIHQANERIAKLNDYIKTCTNQIESEDFWKTLLYARGPQLEEAVYASLDYLGIQYSKPTDKGIEDGTIHDGDFGDWVIEIKGKKEQIGRGDVRQLMEWSDNSDLRGLMIANADCESPPSERRPPLASNASSTASQNGISVLTTLDLYTAISKKQSGCDHIEYLLDAIK